MLRTTILFLLVAFACPATAEPPLTHKDLDWEGPWRWMHVDNVDAKQVAVFEGARAGWLKDLRPDGVLLGDGRPLFWCARGDSVQTYFTFFPFRLWADLDKRSEMVKQTNAVVGETAVAAYDAGDASLVPPHCSQIWRRRESADIVWPATSSLTELSASTGRLERREIDWVRWDEFDRVWAEVQAALVEQEYPLACRVYANTYGGVQGDWMLLWLAPDARAYQQAPSLQDALVRQLGREKGAQLFSALAGLFSRARFLGG